MKPVEPQLAERRRPRGSGEIVAIEPLSKYLNGLLRRLAGRAGA